MLFLSGAKFTVVPAGNVTPLTVPEAAPTLAIEKPYVIDIAPAPISERITGVLVATALLPTKKS